MQVTILSPQTSELVRFEDGERATIEGVETVD
jgi:hypothetical protein